MRTRCKQVISKKDVYLEAIIDLLIIYSQHAVTQDRSFLKSVELKKYSKHVRRNGAGLGRVTLPKKRAPKKKGKKKLSENRESSQRHCFLAGTSEGFHNK